jgi:hypothetical protein
MIHRIISVLTGEMKSRGVYIDEHQLDPLPYDKPSDEINGNTEVHTNE